MMKRKRNMEQLSYGIKHPSDLLIKLRSDADRLTDSPDPYDIFNFILTGAVLAEWIQKFYDSRILRELFVAPKGGNQDWLLPSLSALWITDTTCLPNTHCDFTHHISNVLSICAQTANATKHFHWQDQGDVTSISTDPPIGDFYQYFFTSTAPDLYIEFRGENYGLQQIKDILLQFYSGLIEYLNEIPSPSAVSSDQL